MHITIGAALLILAGISFAWSMGAHYTGACVGMPYATGAIRLWPALLLMSVLTFAGATFASHRVELAVGINLIHPRNHQLAIGVAIVGAAFLLTAAFNALRIPTSTIQILVFSTAGAGFADGAPVRWITIGHLAILWVIAPVAACGLGYLLTHLMDRLAGRLQKLAPHAAAITLVVVGAGASFTMGANDVSNATGVFIMAHLFSPLIAGLLGGAGLALGVLTWGKPLLKRVAFDIVTMDQNMAAAAQFSQALMVMVSVAFGYFTSMNQALVGAMAGTGLARGRQTIQWKTVNGIVRGWILGPSPALLSGFC
ncbi:MAG TPA: anion permease [Armatimonadota bacterium]|nr:anion permease [Armatimonadota bacterium]